MKPDVGIPLRTAVFTGTYRLNFANIDAADAATALRRGQQPLDPRSGRGQAGALPLAVSVARVPRRSPAPPPPPPTPQAPAFLSRRQSVAPTLCRGAAARGGRARACAPREAMAAPPPLPTPRYEHVGPQGPFRDVYEPAEDTFLLLDALERDAARLRQAR